MAWTCTIGKPIRDPQQPLQLLAVMTFDNGSLQISEEVRGVFNPDTVNADLAEKARLRIKNVLEPVDACIAAISVGSVTLPDGPSPEVLAAMAAKADLLAAVEMAKIKELADANPDVQAKLDAYNSAQRALDAQSVAAIAAA